MEKREMKDNPGYYITEDGRVWSDVSQKFLKTFMSNSGYYCVNIRNKNFSKNCFIHRLVAEAFVPNPNNYQYVNHKDENKQNNNKDNLEWCNAKYNLEYNNLAKRSGDKRKKPITQYDLQGNKIRDWDSAKDAGVALGIDPSKITKVCKGKLKTTFHYKWSYHIQD